MRLSAWTLIAAILAATGPTCLARTRTVQALQQLAPPTPEDSGFGLGVAIDGDALLTTAESGVLLYRRGGNGYWSFSRALLPTADASADLAMKNGIAVIRLGTGVHVFTRQGGDYTESAIPEEARHAMGSVAISARRIALGLAPCDDDTLLLTESAPNVWAVTGRVAGPGAGCGDHPVSLDLNNSTLFVRRNDTRVNIYTRDISSANWPGIGGFDLPDAARSGRGPVALQTRVAVAPGSTVYRGEASAWSPAGQAVPIDYANGSGFAYQVVFRDGLLVTTESWGEMHDPYKPYVYVDNGTNFDHVAILQTTGFTDDLDVSGRTVVAGSDFFGMRFVEVFTLPLPIQAPRAIADDFQDRNIDGWQQTPGSQFVLTRQGKQYVYRSAGLTHEAHALLADSDWPDYQSIEADIKPTGVNGSDRWVGLGLRYVDEGNFYYLSWRSSNVLQIKRKVDGTIAVLAQTTLPMTFGSARTLRFSVKRNFLTASVDGAQVLAVSDNSFKHGRTALMAYRVSADFDNVYAAPTPSLNLAWKNYPEVWYDWGRDFTYIRGTWQLTGDDDPDGMSQTNTDTSAYALLGSDTDDQRVTSRVRLDTFNGNGSQVAWFGLFARYRDAANYYQVSLRSSNQLQIRKVVNGQLTVLAATPLTVTPGVFHDLRFDVFGHQLHAYLDDVLVAQALDGAVSSGHYGVGTYRTAATFQTFMVDQP
jgi:hypothetical protein